MNTKSATSPRHAGGLLDRYGPWAVVTGTSSTGTVRPGWLSKLLESDLSPLPRRLRTRIMAGMVS